MTYDWEQLRELRQLHSDLMLTLDRIDRLGGRLEGREYLHRLAREAALRMAAIRPRRRLTAADWEAAGQQRMW